MKHLRHIASLLCLLFSTWAIAQEPSEQLNNDPNTGQSLDLGSQKSEDEQRKRYLEDLSKKSLSRLTSELRIVESQIKEKEAAFNKLSRIQAFLDRKIPQWNKDLRKSSTDLGDIWKSFTDQMEKLEKLNSPNPSKRDLAEAKKALNAFRNLHQSSLQEFHGIDLNEELQDLGEYSSPVELNTSNVSRFVWALNTPEDTDTDEGTHEVLKKALADSRLYDKDGMQGMLDKDRARIEKELSELQKSLKKAVMTLSRDLASLKSRKEVLDQVMDEKSGTDNKLTYAIYCMVAALVVLYVATLFAREKIQSTIFENRTLVEMIGMAFLLLTIIILGTGEKMDRSVLGALLGTVGGYIFGQQTRSSNRPKRRAQTKADDVPRKKRRKAIDLMTENVQRAAQEVMTTPPSTKAPETLPDTALSIPVARAESIPPEDMNALQGKKPAEG